MKNANSLNIKANKIQKIKISEIEKNPNQPRKVFKESSIHSLADSIAQNGLLQPLSVRKRGKGYELIAGERRLRALVMLGEQYAPCVVMDADTNSSAVLSIIENIQRCDLNIFEEALAIETLIERLSLTQGQVAEKLSLSQSAVANKLRILRLSQSEREKIIKNELTERHARALLKIEDELKRERALNHICANRLNVTQSENYIENLLSDNKKGKTTFIFKDLRIFISTINKAIDTMRKSGVRASATRDESDSFIEYTIRIPKPCEAVRK